MRHPTPLRRAIKRVNGKSVTLQQSANRAEQQKMDGRSLAQLSLWMLRFAELIEEHKSLLTELDIAIGDGDHGINMQRGGQRLRQRIADGAIDESELPLFLRSVAMTLLNGIGGAAGALYGSFFLNAAKSASTDGDQSVSLAELTQILEHGLEGVQQRGKAQAGEKTMIDALQPAVDALKQETARDAAFAQALESAAQAAEAGTVATQQMEAAKGRASYLGPRSIGHQDPGATSMYLLVLAAKEALSADES